MVKSILIWWLADVSSLYYICCSKFLNLTIRFYYIYFQMRILKKERIKIILKVIRLSLIRFRIEIISLDNHITRRLIRCTMRSNRMLDQCLTVELHWIAHKVSWCLTFRLSKKKTEINFISNFIWFRSCYFQNTVSRNVMTFSFSFFKTKIIKIVSVGHRMQVVAAVVVVLVVKSWVVKIGENKKRYEIEISTQKKAKLFV